MRHAEANGELWTGTGALPFPESPEQWSFLHQRSRDVDGTQISKLTAFGASGFKWLPSQRLMLPASWPEIR